MNFAGVIIHYEKYKRVPKGHASLVVLLWSCAHEDQTFQWKHTDLGFHLAPIWSVQFADQASCFSPESFRPSNSAQMWLRWVCGLIWERRVFLGSTVMSGGVFLCRSLKRCGVCGRFVREGSRVCCVMETLLQLPEWEKREHCELPVAPNQNLLVHRDGIDFVFLVFFFLSVFFLWFLSVRCKCTSDTPSWFLQPFLKINYLVWTQ